MHGRCWWGGHRVLWGHPWSPAPMHQGSGMAGTAPTAAALTSRRFEPRQLTAIACKAAQYRCGRRRQLTSLQHVCARARQRKEKTSSLCSTTKRNSADTETALAEVPDPQKCLNWVGAKCHQDSKPYITFIKEIATHEHVCFMFS